jgi:hypothetical protein
MVNTNLKSEVEKWIREVFLPKQYSQSFAPKRLELRSKTQSRFDAVSKDGEIVVIICTDAGTTPSGKVMEEALMRVRSDALKMLWLDSTPSQRLMIVTDSSMMDVVKQERKKGRFPKELQILNVKLPADLANRIANSQGSTLEEPIP